MAVPFRSAAGLDVGGAVPLFQARLLNGPAPGPRFRQRYDLARDGRFLLNVPLVTRPPHRPSSRTGKPRS